MKPEFEYVVQYESRLHGTKVVETLHDRTLARLHALRNTPADVFVFSRGKLMFSYNTEAAS